MKPITQEDLLSLEEYDRQRKEIQRRMKAHKDRRRLDLDDYISVFFEDRETMWYQIQEMAKAERLYKPEELQEELAVYNPMLPDGNNLKATMMIQYDDRPVRLEKLAELVGIEHQIWLQVDDHERVYAIADEDLDRSTPDKTSSVHFMRFELGEAMIADWKAGATVRMGCDHENRPLEVTLSKERQEELAGDFQ